MGDTLDVVLRFTLTSTPIQQVHLEKLYKSYQS